jgi:uncharacterized protein (TIGR02391 family)
VSIPSFSDAILSSVAHSIGDAGGPLIGRIIADILSAGGIPDTSIERTKWKVVYHAFKGIQSSDHCGNRVGAFLESALDPARWSADEHRVGYDRARENINRALLTTGLEIGKSGKLRGVAPATTVDEAHERANRLRALLEKRGVHHLVLTSCAKLVLRDDNYFHAVFEATKSVAERLRDMAGATSDGNVLVDETLECGSRQFPIVALNRYHTPSLKNEQKGITHLTRGLFHAFRNVAAHELAVSWPVSEQDALDMMSTASLIHRRLDSAVVTTQYQR